MLRFRCRDRVVVNAKPCSCGRGGIRVRCIGRTDDLLIVRGVNLFPTALREVVAEFGRGRRPILIRPAHAGVRQDAPPRVLVELSRATPLPSSRARSADAIRTPARRHHRGRARPLRHAAAQRVQERLVDFCESAGAR